MERINYMSEAMELAADALEKRDPEAIRDIRRQVENWIMDDTEQSAMCRLLDTMTEAAYDLEAYE